MDVIDDSAVNGLLVFFDPLPTTAFFVVELARRLLPDELVVVAAVAAAAATVLFSILKLFSFNLLNKDESELSLFVLLLLLLVSLIVASCLFNLISV